SELVCAVYAAAIAAHGFSRENERGGSQRLREAEGCAKLVLKKLMKPGDANAYDPHRTAP
ncbi:MAG: hypothetical protein IKS78_05790, partial [Clostridia bacterium]|nr:hypothetical protein [Clostridia bacterium]